MMMNWNALTFDEVTSVALYLIITNRYNLILYLHLIEDN